jgi:hypothetical protein
MVVRTCVMNSGAEEKQKRFEERVALRGWGILYGLPGEVAKLR